MATSTGKNFANYQNFSEVPYTRLEAMIARVIRLMGIVFPFEQQIQYEQNRAYEAL
jgi:hypothetical protein